MRARAKRIRRRQIKQWSGEHTACQDYECTKCDTPIRAYSLYERIVYAAGEFWQKIEVERYHSRPECPDAYYTGN